MADGAWTRTPDPGPALADPASSSSTFNSSSNSNSNSTPRPRSPSSPSRESHGATARDFRDSFGEDLTRALDLDTWRSGRDLSDEYKRIEEEARDSIDRENELLRNVRRWVFPRLGKFAGAPTEAGVYQADARAIEKIHRGLLFKGSVEACDGTIQVHDTLPLTVYQIGVSLVSYRGDQDTWFQRLYRRELRSANRDPMEEVLQVLVRREGRGGLNQDGSLDNLSNLARRAVMAYAERAILLKRSEAAWRIGHGNPAPTQLLTDDSGPDMIIQSARVIRELVEKHQKFVFVASEPGDRALLTIGQALRPLEYAIVDTLRDRVRRVVENGRYPNDFDGVTVDPTWEGEELTPARWIAALRDVTAPRIVVGLFRATRLAPAQVFYAHEDHAHLAAQIALADSVLQEHRGFPLLIDLADHCCRAVFGADSLKPLVAAAYARAGAPWRFLSERQSRRD